MKLATTLAALAAVGGALTATTAAAAPVLWAGNGHYYEFVNNNVDFDAALAAAEAAVFPGYEGYLATITSADEDTFVGGLVLAGRGNYGGTWVGGSDRETEGVWKWLVGPEAGQVFWNAGPVLGQFSNFPGGEPNDFFGEDALSAFYFGDLRWNDLRGADLAGYVVEYRVASTGGVPEPAAWALMILGFGGVGASLRRRRAFVPA